MEFIKTMKKREFIEMSLKAVAAFCAVFLAIILMVGMIYSIQLNSLMNADQRSSNRDTTIVYCIQQGDEDKYFLISFDPEASSWEHAWSAAKGESQLMSKADCEAMVGNSAKEVIFRAPNVFELTINGTHYIVMAVFVAAVAGFFVYKFIALTKQYKDIEEKFEKTGTIELG